MTKTHEILQPIPADGVEFELTLDADDPLQMVWNCGYNSHGWKFTGSSVVVPQTRSFKLVRVGYCTNLNEVREKLAVHGSISEGQWREAFKKAFPRNDRQGTIGFADSSWVSPPDSCARFPVLTGNGRTWSSHFSWDGDDLDGLWRWLVASASK